MPELRKDPITREWVIVAMERARRPTDFAGRLQPVSEEETGGTCPFCPGNEHMTPPEIMSYRAPASARDAPGWWLRVVPNKFPALAIEGDLGKTGYGIYDRMNGIGAHEVILESAEHHQDLATMGERAVEDVLWAYRARYLDLRKDERLKYVLVFRNYGRVAGASLSHPHSQLIATPMVPRDALDEIEGSELYARYRERCVYCDIIQQEEAQKERLVFANEHFVVFEPFASKYPFETWIVPREHANSFALISSAQQAGFARTLKQTLWAIRGCLNDPPYNYTLHTAPCVEDRDFHWHLEIFPRLTIAAGFEMGTGIYINVTPPEEAARYLREAAQEKGEMPEAAEVEIASATAGVGRNGSG